MTETKVSLTVLVPGTIPFSKQLCFENSEIEDIKTGEKRIVETPIEGMTDEHHFSLEFKDRKTGKPYKKWYTYHTRKCQPAKQVMNLCTEAYEYMISEKEVPSWFRTPGKSPVTEWKALTPEARLKLHLDRIAGTLNGVVGDYQVMDD